METFKYFVCKKEGGCRLTDLNLPLSKGQKFKREKKTVESSRSMRAAISAGWIREVNKREFESKGTTKKIRRKRKTTSNKE